MLFHVQDRKESNMKGKEKERRVIFILIQMANQT